MMDVAEATGPLRVQDFTTALARFQLPPDRCDHRAPTRLLDLVLDALDAVVEAVTNGPSSLLLFGTHADPQGVLLERLPFAREIDDLAVGQPAAEPLAPLDDRGMLGEEEVSQGDQGYRLAALAGDVAGGLRHDSLLGRRAVPWTSDVSDARR